MEDRYHPPTQIQGDVLVMLGGGATSGTPDVNGAGQLSGSAANRLLTVVRLYNKTNLPIILSGGQVFSDSSNEASIARRQLIELGVPKNKIIVEDKSRNTEENAKYVKEMLSRHHFKQPILVTSAFHMERSVRNFSGVGVTVTPYPTDYKSSRPITLYANKLVPSANALSNVSTALKEYIGIAALSF
ncbi:YdcF family protein [Aneurinibacillus tyrosinisolvens]|uniref:YdcF family protein n=1 Tax=Aneurinibacillus tyrosinisolvens TaxID=1443435 RepID=UPI001F1D299C|nr:YdcF family protein [Aneurinibacillus tyrosinisolvens]